MEEGDLNSRCKNSQNDIANHHLRPLSHLPPLLIFK